MKTKEEVLALLVALGSTKEEVAKKLIALGIKGDRRQCQACPIVKYLLCNDVQHAGLGVEVIYVMSRIGVGITYDFYWYAISIYPQLTGIRDFIIAFDRGEYPQCEVSQ